MSAPAGSGRTPSRSGTWIDRRKGRRNQGGGGFVVLFVGFLPARSQVPVADGVAAVPALKPSITDSWLIPLLALRPRRIRQGMSHPIRID